MLSRHPQLAIAAIEAIGSWSNVEAFLLRLYVSLLGGAEELAADMYLSLETQSAKAQALQTVARKKLSEENLALLNAILAIAKTSQKSRDKLAHHVWGESPDLPDALLLIDPKASAKGDYSKENIYVYRMNDLTQIIATNDRICGFGLSLGFILSDHPANLDNRLYDELCSEPEIRERLDRQA